MATVQQRLVQSQKQTQSLVMAPQMRQSLKILQVSALELRNTILEELETNPTLEEESHQDFSFDAGPKPTDTKDTSDEMNFKDDFAILQKLDEDWRDYFNQTNAQRSYTSSDAEKRQHFFDSLVGETSLEEHITQQLQIGTASDKAKKAIPYILGSLDARGFLASPPEEIAGLAKLPLEDILESIEVLKRLDPQGLACQNIEECLLFQLEQVGKEDSLAARIIKNDFSLLLRKRIPELAKKYNTSIDEVQNAIKLITTLDPAPGRKFSEDTNRSITADIVVEKDDNQWVIHMNDYYIPRLRINPVYKRLLTKPTLSKEEKEYLKTKMQSSRTLMHAIEQRQTTIEQIANHLLDLQKGFFDEGISKLQPLTMSIMAERIGVHETTISRAIANKYIQTPHGIFEMRFFFTSGYQNEAGENIANTSIKDEIAKIITAENPTKPYSDQAIANMLEEQGTKIARRTVAKYREELGILPTNLRRQYL